MSIKIINENIGANGVYMNNNIKEAETEELFLENKDNKRFFNGVEVYTTLSKTLKANASRIDKNTHKTYTKTKICTNWCRYINLSIFNELESKKEQITALKWIREQFNANNIFVGKIWRDAKKMPFKLGNKKLESSTLVLNIGTAIFCSSKNKGLCSLCGGCYAFSAEIQYLNTVLYRIEQNIKFYELSAEDIAKQILNKAKYNDIRFVRFNESGDIFNVSDIVKMQRIAKIIYNERGIFTYTYSHRLDLPLEDFNTDYFNINKSDIDFIAVDSFENNHNSFICCGVCKECVFCKFKANKPILVLKHGALCGIDNRSIGVKYYDSLIRLYYFKAFDLNARGYTANYNGVIY